MFGDSKHVTVSISLLTPTLQYPETLVVKAATPAIEPRILKSKVHRNSGTGVGFKAVDNARPVHILSIQKNSKVAFFLPEHKSSRVSTYLVESCYMIIQLVHTVYTCKSTKFHS